MEAHQEDSDKAGSGKSLKKYRKGISFEYIDGGDCLEEEGSKQLLLNVISCFVFRTMKDILLELKLSIGCADF